MELFSIFDLMLFFFPLLLDLMAYPNLVPVTNNLGIHVAASNFALSRLAILPRVFVVKI